MNFYQFSYWPGLLLSFLIFVAVLIVLERKFFALVKTYWFYRRSAFSYISSFLLVLGFGGLLIGLLDLRGQEEKVKTDVPTAKTIILIDTSASMLAEDVKPSRLQKATLIAKHFARKAAGQQISIVAFAEIQKKIVPFTTDLDLIDARLDSIKTLRNQYGSSSLTAAIQESLQYFRETGSEARGNILVLTDGEETAQAIDLKIPKEVHVALVGVGTSQGARIPMDDARGFRFGYKRSGSQEVVTKLNENFFKTAAADMPTARYWITNSYSLPSEEILDFFSGDLEKGKDQQDMTIRPVKMELIVIPALLLLALSYFFKALRIFTLGILFFILPVKAQDKENEPPKITPELQSQLNELQRGELSPVQKLKLADALYKAGSQKEALSLFEENLDPSHVDPKLPIEAYMNYGTGLLEQGKIQEGLSVYDRIKGKLDPKSPLREAMDKNTVASFKKQQEQKKKDEQQKKDQKENKDKKDNKDQKGDQQKKDSQKGDSKDEKTEDQKPEDQKKDGKGQEGEDKEKKDANDQKDQQDSKPQPMAPKEIPAKLKQLMSDDRQLQMKMIENGTRDLNQRKSRENKDW
jgi:Ca-activated chloride channel family protein